jgi:hypothetical protein
MEEAAAGEDHSRERLAVTTFTRVNATWVILAAAALGLASQWLRG